jgi:hypothetical protein
MASSQILSTWLGNIVDTGIGLWYRPASQCSPGGPVRQPYATVDYSPSQGLRIWLQESGEGEGKLPWRKMEQPYSPNFSDLAECVILCTSWLPSPGKVYCRAVNIWVTLVELRVPILSAKAGHQLSIYCIKELLGRNSPHLASVNSVYKI